MPSRKERIPVVLDTNVLVGYYLSHSARSSNARVFKLWRDERKLQLLVCEEVAAEYLEVLPRLSVRPSLIERLKQRLAKRETVSHVNLGRRYYFSRDADDNVWLALAAAGKAEYLITNDGDLLDIPALTQRLFRFKILRPAQFLAALKERR
ncbi:MAG: putative toxin-antitoxin system toxin component, PIN family [Planctomycetota bacterium]|nr:putative toxin-antitoxin system toxin component, PIN family [Planctomycetota bacterium]